jgi:hypothetical protein
MPKLRRKRCICRLTAHSCGMFAPMRLLLALLFVSCAAAAETPLAIQGYDPVAYFTLEKATRGDPRHELVWDEHRWRFSTAAHLEAFKANPVQYAPQFANYCAVALSRGEVRTANPEYWLISEGRLYLFGKPAGPELFRKDLKRSIEGANRHRALIDKAPR